MDDGIGYLLKFMYYFPPLKGTLENGDALEELAILTLKVKEYFERWKMHPAFNSAMEMFGKQDWWNPKVIYAYKHEEIFKGYPYSYMFGNLMDLASPSQYNWALRTFKAEFSHIMPVDNETPLSIKRIGWISNRPSNDCAARFHLRKILPSKLHKYISIGRSWKRLKKSHFLRMAVLRGEIPNEALTQSGKSFQPAWYREKTKKEFVLQDPENQGLFRAVSDYMPPETFYDIVTGNIDYHSIDGLVTHQLKLL